MTRPGLMVILLCLVLLIGARQVLLLDHHLTCPLPVHGPEGLRAQRGLKAGTLKVVWDRIGHGDALVEVQINDGTQTFTKLVKPGYQWIQFDGLPQGRHLDIKAALVRDSYIISTVSTLQLLAIQTKAGYPKPPTSKPQATPIPAPTALTLNCPTEIRTIGGDIIEGEFACWG